MWSRERTSPPPPPHWTHRRSKTQPCVLNHDDVRVKSALQLKGSRALADRRSLGVIDFQDNSLHQQAAPNVFILQTSVLFPYPPPCACSRAFLQAFLHMPLARHLCSAPPALGAWPHDDTSWQARLPSGLCSTNKGCLSEGQKRRKAGYLPPTHPIPAWLPFRGSGSGKQLPDGRPSHSAQVMLSLPLTSGLWVALSPHRASLASSLAASSDT